MGVSLEDARAWLRLGAGDEDALVERLIGASVNICEAFVGQWLIERAGVEAVPLRDGVARVATRPVVAVEEVAIVVAGGGETILDTDDYRVDIVDGRALVTIPGAEGAARVRIAYRAGLAAADDALPEAIRHGLVRMVQHLYAARDDRERTPPAAIAALWQPWRRLTLGSPG